jgi:arylsulfatase A-like enzyme
MSGWFLSLALLLGVQSSPKGPASPQPEPPPARNLLLIVVDTLRFDAGLPGASRENAALPPFLRRRGRQFPHAFSSSTWTIPGVNGILTGYLPLESNALLPGVPTAAPGATLAERLRRAGFATEGVVSNPLVIGSGVERGFEHIDCRKDVQRYAPATTEAALDRLRKLRGGKRWFLWVHYFEPHGPYLPPPGLVHLPTDPGPPLKVSNLVVSPRGELPRYQYRRECRGRYDYVARYRAYAMYVLTEVQKLLHAADNAGLLEDTAIIFTSDHAELLGEEDYWCQHGGPIIPAVVHVPLVVLRSTAEPATSDPRYCSTIDIPETALDLLGLSSAKQTRGEDLEAPPARRRDPVAIEQVTAAQAEAAEVFPGVMVVGSKSGASRCYDVSHRPIRRLPSLSLAPEQAQSFDAFRRSFFERARPIMERAEHPPPEMIEKLRSLGYLAGR